MTRVARNMVGFYHKIACCLWLVSTLAAGEVPFSHKRHAALKIECAYCHATAAKAERASFPEAGKCMTCHQAVQKDSPDIQRLAALPADARMTPATPLYKVADFIFFSHARHRTAKVRCETCHGDVWQHDTVKLAMPMTMKACIDCHKANQATIACNKCHELNQ